MEVAHGRIRHSDRAGLSAAQGRYTGRTVRPGAALPFARLKDDYAASMGVLREALMRLTAEGLTVNQPQFGFRVISLSIEDLTD